MFKFVENLVGDLAGEKKVVATVQAERGEKIWVRKKDPDFSSLWEPLSVASVSADKRSVHVSDEVTKKIFEVDSTETLHYDPSHELDYDDCTRVNYLHEASLLNHLQRRYMEDDIYTFFGDTLISVNPYYDIDGLYDKDVPIHKPHVFTVAERAYEALTKKRRSQSVVINGDSGAGKTEAAKKIMNHLVKLSKEGSGSATPKIENIVLSSMPVIEAFGNSVTLRNDNSSRFGRFVQIMYSDKGKITGMNTLHFLLEKSRIIKRSPGERNYHIFYQACAGLSHKGFELAENYNYLNPVLDSSNYQGIIPDDSADFQRTVDALRTIGVADKVQDDIWKILLAILSIGNIEFVRADHDKSNVGACKIAESTMLYLETAAEALNISNAKDLETALVSHTIHAGGNNEETTIQLTIPQASDSRDALAKYLYSALFDWVIEELNRQSFASSNGGNKKGGRKKYRFIGILDIFGFEDLEHNSFEQVCVNYANELLQRQFDYYVIESEKRLFKEEGIEFPDMVLPSIRNSEMVLSLLTDNVFKLLEEQCMLRTGSDSGFLHQLEKVKSSNEKFAMDWKNNNGFVIKHFAGDVSYDTEGFVAKNNDSLYNNLRSLVEKNASGLLKTQVNPIDAGQARKMASRGTVLKKFQKDMNSLVSTLSKTDQSFIRCIKPNSDQASHEWDVNLSLSQLNYLGIMQAIRVHQDTYPIRRNFDFIAEKYHTLLEETKIDYVKGKNDLQVCRAILVEKLGAESEYKLWQCGNTKVFLGNEVLFELDSIVNEKRLAYLASLTDEERRQQEEEERQRQMREIQEAREKFEREKAEAKRKKEEEERLLREKLERERKQREEEERQRQRKLEEERRQQEEEARLRRIAEDDEKRKKEEEAMRLRIAQEEAQKKEQLKAEENAMRARLEEEKEKIRLEAEEKALALEQEESTRLTRIAMEEEKIRKKEKEIEERLKMLEAQAQLHAVEEDKKRKQIEAEEKRLKETQARLADEETAKLKQIQEQEEKLKNEKQELLEKQQAEQLAIANEKEKIKREEQRLQQLEAERIQREEQARLKREEDERKRLEKERLEQERKAKIREKKKRAALKAKKQEEKAAKHKRRKAKINAAIKYQAMIRGAIIRYRYRDVLNRRKMFEHTLDPNEIVVMASLVLKATSVKSAKYMLVFTSKQRLMLLQPITGRIEEQIVFDKKTSKATASTGQEIQIFFKDKTGKVNTWKFLDLLNQPYVWVQTLTTLVDYTTEDYVTTGYQRLLKGKVKRSAVHFPLRCGHLPIHGAQKQQKPRLFVLVLNQGVCELKWYQKDTDKEFHGQLMVNRKMEVTIPLGDALDGMLNTNMFTLRVKKKKGVKSYHLQAKSKTDLNNWVAILRHYVEIDKRRKAPIKEVDTLKSKPKKKRDPRNSKNFDGKSLLRALGDDSATQANYRTLKHRAS